MPIEGGAATPTKKSIVFADDDPMILEAMTEVLSAEGYAVHAARDGLEALALIRAVKPDYIILDVMLPKLDGGRICAAVRQDPLLRSTPIVAFSGLSPQDYRFFPQLSADAYVAKGRLPSAAHNILTAINQFGEAAPERAKGELLGYENFRSRRIVNELLQERRHLIAILRVLAPGALELDRDGRMVMANPGACEILGKREADLVGDLFSSLVPPADRKGVEVLLSELVRSEESAQLVTSFRLLDKAMTVRLAPVVEDGICSGLLIMLEGKDLGTR
jgi:PAS domain S-box-containing protein